MLRNSVLGRRIWYIKRRNTRNIRIYFRLLVFIITLALLWHLVNRSFLPALTGIWEIKAKQTVTDVVMSSINETFDGETKYDNLVLLGRDQSGKITSVETDVVKLNLLAAGIAKDIQKRLAFYEGENIAIPLGTLFGDSILAGLGPDIIIEVGSYGNIHVNFRSVLSEAGINQISHGIWLDINVNMKTSVLLTKKSMEVLTSVPVCETVIVGNVPAVYFDGK